MADYRIWERRDPKTPLAAEVLFYVSAEEFILTDAKWTAYKELHRPTPAPPHHDWSWRYKSSTSSHHAFVALKCAGEIEGMMMVSLEPMPCLFPAGSANELLYVEYLETAPWNQRDYAPEGTRFLAVGACLIDAATALSLEHGCGGRLGLHSLAGAKGFYADQGFRNLGLDPLEELDYFELDDEMVDGKGDL